MPSILWIRQIGKWVQSSHADTVNEHHWEDAMPREHHVWLRAGRDLTGKMNEAPNGEEMLANVPRAGALPADDNGGGCIE
jgi:predicted heme/steroid binding protein